VVQSQPEKIVLEILSQKNPSEKRAEGVAQGVGPEFKPQYHKQNKTKITRQSSMCQVLMWWRPRFNNPG
jgi:hypothetical protein